MSKNYKEKYYSTRKLINKIRVSNRSGSYKNCFKYHKQNTDEHEDTKYEIFKKLRKQGYDCWTEVIFENGYRADIVAIKEGNGWIVEVETPKSSLAFLDEKMNDKKKNYPDDFYFVEVNTDEFDKEEFCI
ncbi:MAG: hypothetical protein ACOC5T_06355 [Elusimicrobiota bacterium]